MIKRNETPMNNNINDHDSNMSVIGIIQNINGNHDSIVNLDNNNNGIIIRNSTITINNNNNTGNNFSISQGKETKEIATPMISGQSSISNNPSDKHETNVSNSFTFTENISLENNILEQNNSENNDLVQIINNMSRGKKIII